MEERGRGGGEEERRWDEGLVEERNGMGVGRKRVG